MEILTKINKIIALAKILDEPVCSCDGASLKFIVSLAYNFSGTKYDGKNITNAALDCPVSKNLFCAAVNLFRALPKPIMDKLGKILS